MLARQLRFDDGGDLMAANLLGRGAREIRRGPDEPMPHLLMARERFVGVSDDAFWVGALVAQDEHRKRFCAVRALNADDNRRAHFSLSFERRFEVFGMNVEARARDDGLFFAPLEIETTLFVK